MNLFRKFISLLVSWLNRSFEPKEHLLCDYDRIRAEIKPCDVLLIDGRSRKDCVVHAISGSPWTHSVLYVGRLIDIDDPDLRTLIRQHIECEPDTQLIVQAKLGQGICIRPLDELERENMRLCRPKGMADKDAVQVVRYAISKLGADKEVYQLFDLLKFFFPWSWLPKGWRYPLFRHNPGAHSRLASSELIAEAFGFIQFPIMPLVKKTGANGAQLFRRTPKLCLPSDIDVSPYFDVVKYPFIDFANYNGHNLLPWKGSGVLSGEENNLHLSHNSDENKLRVVKPSSGD